MSLALSRADSLATIMKKLYSDFRKIKSQVPNVQQR